MITPFDNYINYIAHKTVSISPALDLDDLKQVGILTYLSVQYKSKPYILKSIKNAIYKHANDFNSPVISHNNIYIQSCYDSPSLERIFKEAADNEFSYSVMFEYYINGLSVKDIRAKFDCSKSTIYRILNEGKRELLNA